MDPLTFNTASLYSIGDILNLPAAMEFLDNEDFGSTMMMLENAIASSPTSVLCREDSDSLDLSLTGLSDAFNVRGTESPLACTEQHLIVANGFGFPNGTSSCLSPDGKIRSSGRVPVGGGDVHIKQETNMPGLSPVMDSFLRESWDDIVNPDSRSGRSIVISTTPSRVNSLTPRFFLPSPSPLGGPLLMKSMPIFAPATLRLISNTSTSSTVSFASSTKSKGTRRAKQCIAEGCTRRAQSNNRCKTHGGGARCQVEGCEKSSQGGGLCRAHGGGKKCRVPGCSKGTQRLGLCYLHGGIRRCIAEGCKKKDRGNGYCISHGGGRRCEADGCSRSVRKGNHCQMHQVLAYDTPFQISQYQGLY